MSGRARPLRTLFFDNRYLLTLAILVIVVAGVSALVNLPRLEDPRITNRFPLVITPVPGASAERVESLVTEKLEEAFEEIPLGTPGSNGAGRQTRLLEQPTGNRKGRRLDDRTLRGSSPLEGQSKQVTQHGYLLPFVHLRLLSRVG